MNLKGYKFNLKAKPNNYGFGHDWSLNISKGKKINSFWLGQSVKVCSRLIGIEQNDLVDLVKSKVGSIDFDKPKVRDCIIEYILSASFDVEVEDLKYIKEEALNKMFNVEAWELAVE